MGGRGLTDLAVSCVIPAFNATRFIGEAVESVLLQTRPCAAIFLIDDGSTDGTADHVRHSFPQVEVITTRNRGQACARNEGIRLVSTPLVAFLDADDVWLPTKLERQVELFNAQPDSGLIVCDYVIADAELRPRFIVPGGGGRARLLRAVCLDGWGVAISSTALMPAAVAREVGGFDDSMSTSTDLDFALRVSDTYRVVAVSLPLAIYRQHGIGPRASRDVAAWEHDVRLLHARVLPAQSDRQRARATANLQLRLARHALSGGRVGAALRMVAVSLRSAPLRPVTATASALIRWGRFRVAVALRRRELREAMSGLRTGT